MTVLTVLQTGPLSALEIVMLAIVALCAAVPLLLSRWRPVVVWAGLFTVLAMLASAETTDRAARGCRSVISSAGDTLERIVCDRP